MRSSPRTAGSSGCGRARPVSPGRPRRPTDRPRAFWPASRPRAPRTRSAPCCRCGVFSPRTSRRDPCPCRTVPSFPLERHDVAARDGAGLTGAEYAPQPGRGMRGQRDGREHRRRGHGRERARPAQTPFARQCHVVSSPPSTRRARTGVARPPVLTAGIRAHRLAASRALSVPTRPHEGAESAISPVGDRWGMRRRLRRKPDFLRPVRGRRRGVTGSGATYRVILMAYDRRTGRFLGKDPRDAARCP